MLVKPNPGNSIHGKQAVITGHKKPEAWSWANYNLVIIYLFIFIARVEKKKRDFLLFYREF